ncbi:hypothetical protein PAPYR_6902 [Paratrimastix pyriformis]|uniref:Uncharacterized protein n=1 Tax=Paratrimastix pyriformis TaxID=342808 RepID=A0ABQ8UIK7_9EUKA|nr:hypothetical protein PAPYR_6902 [Paratrimastix pyriformis]
MEPPMVRIIDATKTQFFAPTNVVAGQPYTMIIFPHDSSDQPLSCATGLSAALSVPTAWGGATPGDISFLCGPGLSRIPSGTGGFQVGFGGASNTLQPHYESSIYHYVYLDSVNPPKMVAFKYNAAGSWEHRAYWGQNLLTNSVDGTPARWRAGDLPPAGSWQRLVVPAASVGLEGLQVTDLAIALDSGDPEVTCVAAYGSFGVLVGGVEYPWFEGAYPVGATNAPATEWVRPSDMLSSPTSVTAVLAPLMVRFLATTAAGPFSTSVTTAEGVPLLGSPAPVTVIPCGYALSSAPYYAGRAITVTMHARDLYGNLIACTTATASLPFLIYMNGANLEGTSSLTWTCSSNNFVGAVVPTAAGTITLRISTRTLREDRITVTLVVDPDPSCISASLSSYSLGLTALGAVPAQDTLSATAVDCSGNGIPCTPATAGIPFRVLVDRVPVTATWSCGTGNTFVATFTVTTAGSSVPVEPEAIGNGVIVQGCYSVFISPGPAVMANSDFLYLGLAYRGASFPLWITPRDAYGNPVTCSGVSSSNFLPSSVGVVPDFTTSCPTEPGERYNMPQFAMVFHSTGAAALSVFYGGSGNAMLARYYEDLAVAETGSADWGWELSSIRWSATYPPVPGPKTLMHLRHMTGATWRDETPRHHHASYLVGSNLELTHRYGGGYYLPPGQNSQRIDLPVRALQKLADGAQWTMHTWMQSLSSNPAFPVLAMDDGATFLPTVVLETSGDIRLAGSATPLATQWTTIAGVGPPFLLTATRSGSAYAAYINGVSVGSVPMFGLPSAKTMIAWSLAHARSSASWANSEFEGQFWEVALMDGAASAMEVAAFFEATRVRYGLASAESSRTMAVVAGTPINVTVYAATPNQDQFVCRNGVSHPFTIEVSPAIPEGTVVWSCTPEGLYLAVWTLTRSDIYRVVLESSGATAGDPPLVITVFPGPVDPAHCIQTTSAAGDVGMRQAVMLVAADQYDNRIGCVDGTAGTLASITWGGTPLTIYLDPAHAPSTVLLRWHAGTGWLDHGASWGLDLLGSLEPGAAPKQMGPLPPTGRWVRLEVAAAAVGLAGASIQGVSFGLIGGQAVWGATGLIGVTPWLEGSLPAGATPSPADPAAGMEAWEWVPAEGLTHPLSPTTAADSSEPIYWSTFMPAACTASPRTLSVQIGAHTVPTDVAVTITGPPTAGSSVIKPPGSPPGGVALLAVQPADLSGNPVFCGAPGWVSPLSLTLAGVPLEATWSCADSLARIDNCAGSCQVGQSLAGGVVPAAGDSLYAWVVIANTVTSPLTALMLQARAGGSWEHRAVWGDPGAFDAAVLAPTGQRTLMGGLPDRGTWVRVEVPLAAVGLTPGDGAGLTDLGLAIAGGQVAVGSMGLLRADGTEVPFPTPMTAAGGLLAGLEATAIVDPAVWVSPTTASPGAGRRAMLARWTTPRPPSAGTLELHFPDGTLKPVGLSTIGPPDVSHSGLRVPATLVAGSKALVGVRSLDEDARRVFCGTSSWGSPLALTWNGTYLAGQAWSCAVLLSEAQIPAGTGTRQLCFSGAASAATHIFAWVFLDPDDLPTAMMMQAHASGSWEHRAVWGDPVAIDPSVFSTGHRSLMGALPRSGGWVRLTASMSVLNVPPGTTIDKTALAIAEGRVTMGAIGVILADGSERPHTTLEPATLPGSVAAGRPGPVGWVDPWTVDADMSRFVSLAVWTAATVPGPYSLGVVFPGGVTVEMPVVVVPDVASALGSSYAVSPLSPAVGQSIVVTIHVGDQFANPIGCTAATAATTADVLWESGAILSSWLTWSCGSGGAFVVHFACLDVPTGSYDLAVTIAGLSIAPDTPLAVTAEGVDVGQTVALGALTAMAGSPYPVLVSLATASGAQLACSQADPTEAPLLELDGAAPTDLQWSCASGGHRTADLDAGAGAGAGGAGAEAGHGFTSGAAFAATPPGLESLMYSWVFLDAAARPSALTLRWVVSGAARQVTLPMAEVPADCWVRVGATQGQLGLAAVGPVTGLGWSATGGRAAFGASGYVGAAGGREVPWFQCGLPADAAWVPTGGAGAATGPTMLGATDLLHPMLPPVELGGRPCGADALHWASFTAPCQAGPHTLRLTVATGAEPITRSVTVVPGPIVAALCTVAAPSRAVAGQPLRVVYRARDGCGNEVACTAATAGSTFGLSWSQTVAPAVSWGCTDDLPARFAATLNADAQWGLRVLRPTTYAGAAIGADITVPVMPAVSPADSVLVASRVTAAGAPFAVLIAALTPAGTVDTCLAQWADGPFAITWGEDQPAGAATPAAAAATPADLRWACLPGGHRDEAQPAQHGLFFHGPAPSGASPGFVLPTGGRLFAWVHLDPVDPPRATLRIRWQTPSASATTYWGQADPTPGYIHMGTAMPPAGRWVRLEVPVATAGLGLLPLTGLGYSLSQGRLAMGTVGVLTSPGTAAEVAAVWMSCAMPTGGTITTDADAAHWLGPLAMLDPMAPVPAASGFCGDEALFMGVFGPTRAGNFTLRVVAANGTGPAEGAEVAGSPLVVTVTPGPITAALSSCTTAGLRAVAGAPYALTIAGRDQWGNLVPCVASAASPFTVTWAGGPPPGLQWSCDGAGRSVATVLPTQAAQAVTLEVRLAADGALVGGGSFSLAVAAGPADPAAGSALAPGRVVAGELLAVALTPRDALGNRIGCTDDGGEGDEGGGGGTTSPAGGLLWDGAALTAADEGVRWSCTTGAVRAPSAWAFLSTSSPLAVPAGSPMYAWVYLSPAVTDLRFLLGCALGSRIAHWGPESATPAADTIQMGPLPPSGRWLRVETGPGFLTAGGLACAALDRMALTTAGGPAAYGAVGFLNATTGAPRRWFSCGPPPGTTPAATPHSWLGPEGLLDPLGAAAVGTPCGGEPAFMAEFVPTVAGVHRLVGTLDGAPAAAAFNVTVVPAPIARSACLLNATAEGRVGEPYTFRLAARDRYGNRVGCTAETANATFGAMWSGLTPADLRWACTSGAGDGAGDGDTEGDTEGEFEGTFTPTAAGPFSLALTYGGLLVGPDGGVSLGVTILPGAPTVLSTASGAASGPFGAPVVVAVTAVDCYGRAGAGCTDNATAGAAFGLLVDGAPPGPAAVAWSCGPGGLYVARYLPTALGPVNLTVTCGGVPLAGAPLAPTVVGPRLSHPRPKEASPRCRASVPTNLAPARLACGPVWRVAPARLAFGWLTSSFTAPSPATGCDGPYVLTVAARDPSGAPVPCLAATAAGTFGLLWDGAPALDNGSLEIGPVSWSCAAGGQFAASFAVSQAGAHTVAPTYGGLALAPGPAAVNITAGPIAFLTSAVALASSVVTAGSACIVRISPRDACYNPVPCQDPAQGPAQFRIYLASPLAFRLMPYAMTWSCSAANGSSGPAIFVASFTPTMAGSQRLSVRTLSVRIAAHMPLRVEPGGLSAAESSFGVNGTADTTAGAPLSLVVTGRDAYGNVVACTAATAATTFGLQWDGAAPSAALGLNWTCSADVPALFVATVTPTGAGPHTALDRRPSSPPYAFPFIPSHRRPPVPTAAPLASSSTASIAAGTSELVGLSPAGGTLAAGSPATVRVAGRDAFGNPVPCTAAATATAGESPFTVAAEDGSPLAGLSWACSADVPALFVGTFTPALADVGPHTLTVLCAGAPLLLAGGGSASLNVTVTAIISRPSTPGHNRPPLGRPEQLRHRGRGTAVPAGSQLVVTVTARDAAGTVIPCTGPTANATFGLLVGLAAPAGLTWSCSADLPARFVARLAAPEATGPTSLAVTLGGLPLGGGSGAAITVTPGPLPPVAPPTSLSSPPAVPHHSPRPLPLPAELLIISSRLRPVLPPPPGHLSAAVVSAGRSGFLGGCGGGGECACLAGAACTLLAVAGRDSAGAAVGCTNATAATTFGLQWDGAAPPAGSGDGAAALGLSWSCSADVPSLFVATGTLTAAGSHRVAATYGGLVLGGGGGAAVNLTVTPGPPAASASRVVAAPAGTLTAGSAGTVVLAARDAYGNPIGCSNATAAAAFGLQWAGGGAAAAADAAVRWSCSGAAPALFVGAFGAPTASGAHLLRLPVAVGPGPVSPQQSGLSCPALATAGAPLRVTIAARDAYGNAVPCTAASSDSDADAEGAAAAAGLELQWDGGAAPAGLNWTCSGDVPALFVATFTPTGAGPHTLGARCGGVSLGAGGAAQVEVGPGSLSAGTSALVGLWSGGAEAGAGGTLAAGSPATVRVAGRDAFGNPVPCTATATATAGGAPFTVAAEDGSPLAGLSWACSADVPALFVGTFTPALADVGPHTLTVLCAGAPLLLAGGGSASLNVTVTGPASAGRSSFVIGGGGAGVTAVPAGSQLVVTVTARDAAGTVIPCTGPTANATFGLLVADGGPVVSWGCSAEVPARFVGSVTATGAAGSAHAVTVTALGDGGVLGGGPVTVTISAGLLPQPPHASPSRRPVFGHGICGMPHGAVPCAGAAVVAAGRSVFVAPASIPAGAACTVLVAARDGAGVAVPCTGALAGSTFGLLWDGAGGAAVPGGGGGPTWSCSPETPSRFAAALAPTQAGPHTVAISYGGQPVPTVATGAGAAAAPAPVVVAVVWVTAGAAAAGPSDFGAPATSRADPTAAGATAVTFTARDAYGNRVPCTAATAGATFALLVDGAPAAANVSWGCANATAGSGTGSGESEASVFVARWASGALGAHVLTATCGGAPMSGRAVCTLLPASKPSPITRTCLLPSRTSPVRVAVEARDGYGNRVGCTALTAGTAFELLWDGAPAPQPAPDPAWSCGGTGSSASLTPSSVEEDFVGEVRPPAPGPHVLAVGTRVVAEGGVGASGRLALLAQGNTTLAVTAPAMANTSRLAWVVAPSGGSAAAAAVVVVGLGQNLTLGLEARDAAGALIPCPYASPEPPFGVLWDGAALPQVEWGCAPGNVTLPDGTPGPGSLYRARFAAWAGLPAAGAANGTTAVNCTLEVRCSDGGGGGGSAVVVVVDGGPRLVTVINDTTSPVVGELRLTSSNPAGDGAWARPGDTLRGRFLASEPLRSAAVTIAGHPLAARPTTTTTTAAAAAGEWWEATVVVGPADCAAWEGAALGFAVTEATDLAGNGLRAAPVVAASGAGAVVLDCTAPAVSRLAFGSSNANPRVAQPGDLLTVALTATEPGPPEGVRLTIAGHPVNVILAPAARAGTIASTNHSAGTGTNHSAGTSSNSASAVGVAFVGSYRLGAADAVGPVGFLLSGLADRAGNSLAAALSVATEGPSLIYFVPEEETRRCWGDADCQQGGDGAARCQSTAAGGGGGLVWGCRCTGPQFALVEAAAANNRTSGDACLRVGPAGATGLWAAYLGGALGALLLAGLAALGLLLLVRRRRRRQDDKRIHVVEAAEASGPGGPAALVAVNPLLGAEASDGAFELAALKAPQQQPQPQPADKNDGKLCPDSWSPATPAVVKSDDEAIPPPARSASPVLLTDAMPFPSPSPPPPLAAAALLEMAMARPPEDLGAATSLPAALLRPSAADTAATPPPPPFSAWLAAAPSAPPPPPPPPLAGPTTPPPQPSASLGGELTMADVSLLGSAPPAAAAARGADAPGRVLPGSLDLSLSAAPTPTPSAATATPTEALLRMMQTPTPNPSLDVLLLGAALSARRPRPRPRPHPHRPRVASSDTPPPAPRGTDLNLPPAPRGRLPPPPPPGLPTYEHPLVSDPQPAAEPPSRPTIPGSLTSPSAYPVAAFQETKYADAVFVTDFRSAPAGAPPLVPTPTAPAPTPAPTPSSASRVQPAPLSLTPQPADEIKRLHNAIAHLEQSNTIMMEDPELREYVAENESIIAGMRRTIVGLEARLKEEQDKLVAELRALQLAAQRAHAEQQGQATPPPPTSSAVSSAGDHPLPETGTQAPSASAPSAPGQQGGTPPGDADTQGQGGLYL